MTNTTHTTFLKFVLAIALIVLVGFYTFLWPVLLLVILGQVASIKSQ